jgi:hypothetical protein
MLYMPCSVLLSGRLLARQVNRRSIVPYYALKRTTGLGTTFNVMLLR